MDRRELYFSADEAKALYGGGETVKDAAGLAKAAKAAKPGASVYLAPGEYRVNLII
jgi:hypothetical protein